MKAQMLTLQRELAKTGPVGCIRARNRYQEATKVELK